MKFSEETFNSWKRPASETEEERISNAISMIKDAIRNSEKLKNKNIDIFVQGSYGNNTNVRAKSDVDVCIMLKDTFNSKYPEGLTRDDYGFSSSDYNFRMFKKDVIEALNQKYQNIKIGNKSIKLSSTSYRVDADAIPAFQYRNYYYLNSREPNTFLEGIKFTSKNGEEVINYPKKHIENGKIKNKNTQRRYKRAVRIFKRIRHQMLKDNKSIDKGISSFLIECLLWNVPDNIYNDTDNCISRIEEIILFLYNETKNNINLKWREVSEGLYLFNSNRKWNQEMVNNFLLQMYRYLEI